MIQASSSISVTSAVKVVQKTGQVNEGKYKLTPDGYGKSARGQDRVDLVVVMI